MLVCSQGKDYETTSLVTLEVGVKNEEPLWVCKEKPTDSPNEDFYDSAVIKIKVKDANDPPVFPENPVVLHVVEEEKPGRVLFTPKVTDVDSDVSQIRLSLDFFFSCNLFQINFNILSKILQYKDCHGQNQQCLFMFHLDTWI